MSTPENRLGDVELILENFIVLAKNNHQTAIDTKKPISELIYIAELINQGTFRVSFPFSEINVKRLEVIHTNIKSDWICGMFHYLNHYRSRTFRFKNQHLGLATKPRGELLIKAYELCKECHSRQEEAGINIPWDNASKWFTKIWWDFVGTEFEDSLVEIDPKHSNFKKAIIDRRSAHFKSMKNGENPFLPSKVKIKNDYESVIFSNAHGLRTLIGVAIALTERFSDGKNQFRELYWKPFLKAYSDDIAERRSIRWGHVKFDGPKHQIISGQGRPKLLK